MELSLTPLLGGVMIGAASIGLLATIGRIAGVSGIAWGAIAGPDRDWRILFVLGLMLGGALVHTALGKPIPAASEAPLWLAIVAGLLVGFGTRMGSGCTSGHGVCGLGRRSLRSLVATLSFMFMGVVTVYVTHHLIGGSL